MMRIGLVGSTGFIGQHLGVALSVTERFHSRNIETIQNRSYDWLICAAPSSHKLLANLKPDDDRRQVEALLAQLRTVDCQRLLLISTVSSKDPIESLQPYGRHRKWLEEQLCAHFGERLQVLHLPMVFGPGASKGLIRDLIVEIPLYLREDLVRENGLEAYYDAIGLEQLWVWKGQMSQELAQNLSRVGLSSRDFWPLDQKHQVVAVTELVDALVSHIRHGLPLTYPSYEVTARGVLQTLAGCPPEDYSQTLVQALIKTQQSYVKSD